MGVLEKTILFYLFFFFFFFAASILYVFICLVGEDDINRGKVSMKGFEI